MGVLVCVIGVSPVFLKFFRGLTQLRVKGGCGGGVSLDCSLFLRVHTVDEERLELDEDVGDILVRKLEVESVARVNLVKTQTFNRQYHLLQRRHRHVVLIAIIPCGR